MHMKRKKEEEKIDTSASNCRSHFLFSIFRATRLLITIARVALFLSLS
jgi:hypothetical protein